MPNYNTILKKALYWGDDFDDILDLYEAKLRQLGTVEDINHANAVKSYHTSCNNKALLKTLRTNFNELIKLIGTDNVLIYGRRKSFISFESKLRNYLASGRNLMVKDLFAFRIILLENNSILAINRLYKMAEKVIDYFAHEGLTVCELKTPIDEDFNASDFPEIIVPRKSILKDEYKPYVKDYIYHPKANGYQSLHLLFQTQNGVYFEIQLRTLAQHVWDEEEAGSWEKYKKKKYKNPPKYNPKKILIPGLVTSSKGTIYDTTGLIKAKEILVRSLS